MNKIWTIIMLAAAAILLFMKPELTFSAMVSASNAAVTLSFSLMAVYVIWLGLMRIVDATGLNRVLARLYHPAIRFLFGQTDPETEQYISMNLSANLLGMGNAATPMGVNAMQRLDDGSGTATDGMIMLVVINSTPLTLIPATIISLRLGGGSLSAADIILPSVIATAVSCTVGITLCKLCRKIRISLKKKSAAATVCAQKNPAACKK